MPVNSKVYYLDESGTVIDSSFVSKDGYFEYKPMQLGQQYILKPVIAGVDASQMQIRLIDAQEKVAKLELINQEDLFIQEDSSELIVADREHDGSGAPKVVGAEDPEESTEIIETQEVTADTPPVRPEQAEEAGNFFKITMDYNATESDDLVKYREDIIARVKQEIKEKGTCSIELTSSASTVPTSLEGGNYELSKRRLETGKAMLFKLFEDAGLDMNKISTSSEKSIVSGPDYFTDPGLTKSVFVDYQYFKIDFN